MVMNLNNCLNLYVLTVFYHVHILFLFADIADTHFSIKLEYCMNRWHCVECLTPITCQDIHCTKPSSPFQNES